MPTRPCATAAKPTLTASGGTGYLWSTGGTSAEINITPDITTLYTVEVTDNQGCSSIDSVTVTVNQLPIAPVITAGDTTALCVGDSVLLTSDITEDILWSTGETVAAVMILETGSYTVTYTDPGTGMCGCF